jgi:hypothetical protein
VSTVTHPPTDTPRTLRRAPRTFASLVLSLLLAVGALVVSPAVAHAATESRVRLPAGVSLDLDTWKNFAVFGSTVAYGSQLSTTGGATWNSTPISPSWTFLNDGTMVRKQNNADRVDVRNPSTGLVTSYDVQPNSISFNASSGLYLSPTGGGYGSYNYLTRTASMVTMPSTAGGVTIDTPSLTSSGAVLWSGALPQAGRVGAVSPNPEGQPSAWIPAAAAVATPDALQYVTVDAYRVTFCSRPLTTTGTSTCFTGMEGPSSTFSVSLFNYGSSTVVRIYDASGVDRFDFLWTGGSLIDIQTGGLYIRTAGSRIAIPDSPTHIHGDVPYIVLRTSTTPSIRRVNPDGTLGTSIPLPPTAVAVPTNIAVAPNYVVGSDARDGSTSNPTWFRTLSSAGLGAESLTTRRVTPPSGGGPALLASAARSVVTSTRTDSGTYVTVADRLTTTFNVLRGTLEGLSGPYFLWLDPQGGAGATIVTTLGGRVLTSPSSGRLLFGSIFLGSDKDAVATGVMRIMVSDLAGSSWEEEHPLPAGTAACDLDKTWGDKVSLVCNGTLKIYNYRTGALLGTRTGAGPTISLGDGYAVVALGGGGYGVWALGTGTVTSLPCIDKPADDGVGQIACWDATDLIFEDFSTLAKSAPRLLGERDNGWLDFSYASWTPEIDTTKPLKAGSLVITASDGTVVKTLATPASPDGSLRGLSWDGRDNSGKMVGKSTYTYELRAEAGDGSGAVRAADGTATPTGTFDVTDYWSSFTKASYQDFLGRAPSDAELTAQNHALASGKVTKLDYLTALANSDEWLSTIVTKMYADTLGRDPDAGGLSFWINLLRTKTFTVAEVASRFYSSDEYYTLHAGASTEAWVTSLYAKLLNRTPDADGLQFWIRLTNDKNWGRDKVAYNFYQSEESRRDRVQAIYHVLLNREPDNTGWPFWTQRVLTTGDIALAYNIANSDEYFARAQTRY